MLLADVRYSCVVFMCMCVLRLLLVKVTQSLVVLLQVAAGCFACPAQSTVQVIERFGKVMFRFPLKDSMKA